MKVCSVCVMAKHKATIDTCLREIDVYNTFHMYLIVIISICLYLIAWSLAFQIPKQARVSVAWREDKGIYEYSYSRSTPKRLVLTEKYEEDLIKTSRRSFVENLLFHASSIGAGTYISSLSPREVGAADASPLRNLDDLKKIEEDIYEKVSRRKPNSYTASERDDIDAIIDDLCNLARGTAWERSLLPGTWRVAFLRPGEGGGGLDRRIPFPELPFNESYQKFTLDSVTNVGEVLGDAVRVEVGGSLREDDEGSNLIPKRFVANIDRGDLRGGRRFSVKLPIVGEGIFDGLYLGEKVRIGQNLNGSGALVVQVRMPMPQ